MKGYGFLPFAKNMGKSLSNKCSQKLLDTAEKIYKRCNKNCFKKSNSKKAEATGDLTGNKIADKITNVLKKPVKELPNDEDIKITTHKKRCISPEERQQIINGLRLVPKKYA